MGYIMLRYRRTQSLWVDASIIILGLLLSLNFSYVGFAILSISFFLNLKKNSQKALFLLFLSLILLYYLLPLTIVHLTIITIPLLSFYLKAKGYYQEFEASLFLLSLLLILLLSLPIINVIAQYSPVGAVKDEALLRSIAFTFTAAFFAVLIGVFLSVPVGYILSRKAFPGKSFVEALLDLPIVIPHTVAGIMLLLLYSRGGPIGAVTERWGISFYQTYLGTIVAMTFISSSFIVNQVREGIQSIPIRMEMVARSLGASPDRVFKDVVLPQIKRSILAGSILAWARSISEFGAVVMIAYYPQVVSTYIYTLFTTYSLSRAQSATSLLTLISIVVIIVARLTVRGDKGD